MAVSLCRSLESTWDRPTDAQKKFSSHGVFFFLVVLSSALYDAIMCVWLFPLDKFLVQVLSKSIFVVASLALEYDLIRSHTVDEWAMVFSFTAFLLWYNNENASCRRLHRLSVHRFTCRNMKMGKSDGKKMNAKKWNRKMLKVGEKRPEKKNEKWILCTMNMVEHNGDRHCIILPHNRCTSSSKWTDEKKSSGAHRLRLAMAMKWKFREKVCIYGLQHKWFPFRMQKLKRNDLSNANDNFLISHTFPGGGTKRCDGHKLDVGAIGLAFAHQQHRRIHWGSDSFAN